MLERAGDLLVGLAVGHQPQRRQLARRELDARHALGELRGRGRREIGLAGEHVADAGDQIVGGDVLQHVRLRAGLERARDLFVGVVGREHDDARPRVALADPANDLDAFHHRHPQIEQRHVGVMALVGFDRLDAVAGFGDHAQVGLLVDDVGDAGPEQRVIVDERARWPCRRRPDDGFSWQHGPASAATTAPTPARLRCRCAAP